MLLLAELREIARHVLAPALIIFVKPPVVGQIHAAPREVAMPLSAVYAEAVQAVLFATITVAARLVVLPAPPVGEVTVILAASQLQEPSVAAPILAEFIHIVRPLSAGDAADVAAAKPALTVLARGELVLLQGPRFCLPTARKFPLNT